MLTIGFFNDVLYTENEELGDAVTFDFTGDGFKLLIDSGIFELPCVVVDGRECIDLKEHRQAVRAVFQRYPMPHPKIYEIRDAVEEYRFFTADF